VTDLPSQVCTFPYLNPVTGPFHVEGAEPGDTLAVHILDLTPAAPLLGAYLGGTEAYGAAHARLRRG
jgi:acetamidase/formamidase